MPAHTYDVWTYINTIYVVDTGVVVPHCCAGVRAENGYTRFSGPVRGRHFDLNREEEREDESKSVCFYEKLILQAIVLLNTRQSFQ